MDKTKAIELYNFFINEGYDLGDQDNFFKAFEDENKRVELYDFFVNEGYDVGEVDNFVIQELSDKPVTETKKPETISEYMSSWESSAKAVYNTISESIRPEVKERVKKSFQNASDLNTQLDVSVENAYESLSDKAKQKLTKEDVRDILSQNDISEAYDILEELTVESFISATDPGAKITGPAKLFDEVRDNFENWKKLEQDIVDYNIEEQEVEEENLISKYDVGLLDERIQMNDNLVKSNETILKQLKLLQDQGQDIDQSRIDEVISNITTLEQGKDKLIIAKSEKEEKTKELDNRLATLLKVNNPNMSSEEIALNIERFKDSEDLTYTNPLIFRDLSSLSKYGTYDMESGYFSPNYSQRQQLKKDLDLTEDEASEFIEDVGAFLRNKDITYQKSEKDRSYISNYKNIQGRYGEPESRGNLIKEMKDMEYSEIDLINAMDKDGMFSGRLFTGLDEEDAAPMLNDLFNRFGINVYAGVGRELYKERQDLQAELQTDIDPERRKEIEIRLEDLKGGRAGNYITIQSGDDYIVLNTNESGNKAYLNAQRLKSFVKKNGELQPLEKIDKIQGKSDFGLQLTEDKYIERKSNKIQESINFISSEKDKFQKEFNKLEKDHNATIENARVELQELINSGAPREQVLSKEKELLEKIDQERQGINTYVQEKNEEFKLAGYVLKDNKKAIAKNLESILKMESKKGSYEQAAVNSFLSGIESVSLGTARFLHNTFTNINPLMWVAGAIDDKEGITSAIEDEMKRFNQDVVEASRGSLTSLGTRPNEAYVQAQMETLWGGGVLGLVESLPAIITSVATGGGATGIAAFGMQAADGVWKEMESDPDLKNVSEAEKLMLGSLMALSTGILEEFGLQTILGKNKMLNNLALKSLKKLPVNGTTVALKNIMRGEVQGLIGNFTVPLVSGTIVEASTGLTQAVAETTIKEVYDVAKGKNLFKTEFDEGWQELFKSWGKAAIQEAIGGFLMSSPVAIGNAYVNHNIDKTNNDQFKLFKRLSINPLSRSLLESSIQNDQVSGKITEEEAKQQLRYFNEGITVFESIPETLSTKDQKQYFNLLSEKKQLENIIEDRKGLKETKLEEYSERIQEIDKELDFYNSKPDINLTGNIINTVNLANSLGKKVEFVIDEDANGVSRSLSNFIESNPNGRLGLTGFKSTVKFSELTDIKKNELIESAKDGETNGFILYDDNDTPHAFIDKQYSASNKAGLHVASHEVLHALENGVIDPNLRSKINKELLEKLGEKNANILLKEVQSRYRDKSEQEIEYLTTLSDLISEGDIKIDKGLKSKIGGFARKLISVIPGVDTNSKLKEFLNEGVDTGSKALDFVLSYVEANKLAKNKLTFEQKQQILNSKYEGKPVTEEVVEEAPMVEEVKEEPAKAVELQKKRDEDKALKKEDQTKLTEEQKKEKQLEAAMARDITAKEDVAEQEEAKVVENKSRRSVEASMRGKGFEFEGKTYKYKQAKDKKGYFLTVDGVAQKKKVARVENVSKMFSELTGYEFKDADKKAPTKKKPSAKKIQVKGQANIESKLKGVKFAESVAKAISSLKAEDGKIVFFDIFKGNEVTLEGIDTFSKSDLTLDAVKKIKDYAIEKGWMKVKKPSTEAIDAPIDTEKKVGITKSRSTSKDRRSEYSKQKRDNKKISRFNEDIIYEIIRENESVIGDEMIDKIAEGNIQRLKGELYNNNIGRITLEAKKAYDKGFAVDPTTRITMEEFMSGFTLEFNELIRTYLNKVLDGKFREVPFGAYINENLPKRYAQILDVLKKQFEGAELTGITEEAASKRDLAAIETERRVEELEKSLRKELGLDDNFKERVIDKVKGVFKGRLPHPSDPAFKSKLEQEFERELFDVIREDLFGAKYNEKKKQYQYNWSFIEEKLNEYAEAIYDKLPIQTLVSLNRQTYKKGELIMKPVIDPSTGKQKWMTPEESDKSKDLFGYEVKDREAGNLVWAKQDPIAIKEDFVNFFLNPVVSRKGMRMEGLFKVLAKEIAFDATMEVLRDPEVIERVEALYELQDITLLGNELEVISKELDRSIGLTFSKSVAKDQGIENIVGNRNFNSRLKISINEFLDQKFNKVNDYIEFKDIIESNGLNLEELSGQELEELDSFNNKINSIVNDSITIKNRGKGSIHSLNDRIEDYVDSSFYLKDIKDIAGIDFTIKDLVGVNGEVTDQSEKLIIDIFKTFTLEEIKDITANLRRGIYSGQLIQILTTTANIKEAINNDEKTWTSNVPGRDDKSPKHLILNYNNIPKSENQVKETLKKREENGVMTRNLAIKFLSELQKKYNNEKNKTEKVKKKYIGVILWLANAGGMQSILRTSYTNGLVQNSIFEIRKNLEQLAIDKNFDKLSVKERNKKIEKFFDKRKNKILFEHRPPLNILTKKVTSYIFNNETNDNLVSFLENKAKINTVDRLFGDAIDKFYKTTESLFGDQYIYNPNVMLEYIKLLKDSNVTILKNFTLSMTPYEKLIDTKSKLKIQKVSINEDAQKVYKERIKQQKAAKKVNDLSLIKSKVVKPTTSMTNQDVLSLAATLDEALRIARDPDAPVKKIRVFDFDDTLARTKSNVLYTLPDGTKGKLTAEEFAKKGDKMAAKGAIWDFSEFNKVMKGKKGPLFKVAQAIQEARGTKDVFVLTARAPEAAVAIKEFLDSVGLNIPIENITGLGDSSPFAKSQWVVEKAAEGYNDFYFADDAYKNVRAVQDALDQLTYTKARTQVAIVSDETVIEEQNMNQAINSPTDEGSDGLLSITFSKKNRDLYEKQLTKRRKDLLPEDITFNVDQVFKFVDNLDVPQNKKKKFEKLALHYLANGYLILPEDGYKVVMAEKIAKQMKIDPFSYRNPNEIMALAPEKVEDEAFNPDNEPTFTNKKELPEGITVYDVENTKEGQLATRAAIDANFGRKANPWCLAARVDDELDNAQDYWEEQGIFWMDSVEYNTKEELIKGMSEYKAKGATVVEESYTWNGNKVYVLHIEYDRDKPHPDHGVMFDDVPVDEQGVIIQDDLAGAFRFFKKYGSNKKIAFQNGKLVAFRDGTKDNTQVSQEKLKGQWWDKMDKPHNGIPVKRKAKDGWTEYITVKANGSVEVLYMEKGNPKKGRFIQKKPDGTMMQDVLLGENGKPMSGIRVLEMSEGNTSTQQWEDGKLIYTLEDYTPEFIENNLDEKILFGSKEISIKIDKYTIENYYDGKGNSIETFTEKEGVDKDGNKIVYKELEDPKIAGSLYPIRIFKEFNGEKYLTQWDLNMNKLIKKVTREVRELEGDQLEAEYLKTEAASVMSLEDFKNKGYSYDYLRSAIKNYKLNIGKAAFDKNDKKIIIPVDDYGNPLSTKLLITKSKNIGKQAKPVRDVLRVIDKGSQTQINLTRSTKSNLNETFNLIIEAKTGIAAEKTFDEIAKGIGKKKGKYKFFIPYSAEDFTGLMYPLLAKGKLGDKQMEWFNEVLFNPFARAMNNVSSDRNQLMRDFKEIKKNLKNVPKNLRKEALPGLTYENAVRIYLWDKQGFDIPGLNEETMGNVWELMQEKPELQAFADQLLAINKGDGFAKPDQTWMAGTITTDLLRGLNTTKRKKYLEQWQRNVDIIFSKENLLKLEAAYGKKYVDALKDSLRRMKTGVNRKSSIGVHEQRWLDWVNGSVGVTMFFNMRSALLQTISAINYINWSDNNPAKAALAFANKPQYWKDIATLFKSEFLVDRRNGLRINISESEIADAASKSTNPAKAIVNLILQKGFTLTQFADSWAIASGGATFYRNRIKTYIKQGLSESEAEKKAFQDFREITEESQQSSRPDRISQQQASGIGRVILAFANTPMQYARLMKKSVTDLRHGRGDWKTNVSKIAYYGFIQNVIFNALQQALFALSFDDEDDEDEKKKLTSTANGMLDSILRGLGYAGAAVSVAKNVLLKAYEESEKDRPKYENVAWEVLNISPPIDAKVTKVRSAMRTIDFEFDEIKEKGFSLDSPAYSAGAKVFSAVTNIPLDRLFRKAENIEAAVNEDYETWQKIALWFGWSEWQIKTPEQKAEEDKQKKKDTKAKRKTTYAKKKREKQKHLIELGL